MITKYLNGPITKNKDGLWEVLGNVLRKGTEVEVKIDCGWSSGFVDFVDSIKSYCFYSDALNMTIPLAEGTQIRTQQFI